MSVSTYPILAKWGSGLTRFPSVFRGRLFGIPEQLVEVTDLEKPVVVHWVPVLRDSSVASPVAERIATNTEILGRFRDPNVFIQLGHRAPPQRVRWAGRSCDSITLPNRDTDEKYLSRRANRDSMGLYGLAKVDRRRTSVSDVLVFILLRFTFPPIRRGMEIWATQG